MLNHSLWFWFWAGVGVQFLFIGALRARRQIVARTRWVKTDAAIIRSGFSGMVPEFTVEFSLPNGQLVNATPRTNTMNGQQFVHKRIPLWYDPANPHRCEIELFPISAAIPALHLSAGVLALFMAWGHL